jgi:hypothetical protein
MGAVSGAEAKRETDIENSLEQERDQDGRFQPLYTGAKNISVAFSRKGGGG